MAGDPKRAKPIARLLDAADLDLRYSLSPAPKIDALRQMLATLISLKELARTELLAT